MFSGYSGSMEIILEHIVKMLGGYVQGRSVDVCNYYNHYVRIFSVGKQDCHCYVVVGWVLGHLSMTVSCTVWFRMNSMTPRTLPVAAVDRWLCVLPVGTVWGFYGTGHHPLHAANPPWPCLSS